MRYRITIDDKVNCEASEHEIEADDVGTAIFQLGMKFAFEGAVHRDPRGDMDHPVDVVKVEVPAGWMRMELP